ncbi:hypothetical protein [Atopomonas hussainii]|uniref:hypothetical protein n=1 Tax=Atopomonas hussainii TaxID=1429083 RepID=UPI0009002977|nr:hypothetical protein [Atopomonas hussainii]
MYWLGARRVLLVGVFVFLLVCVVIANQSAVYRNGDEYRYLLAVLWALLAFLLSFILKIVSLLKREKPRPLLVGASWRGACLFIVCLAVCGQPTLHSQYYLAKYELEYYGVWSSGSEDLAVLMRAGKELCLFPSSQHVSFKDVNADGYADIVFDELGLIALHYEVARDSFSGCDAFGV